MWFIISREKIKPKADKSGNAPLSPFPLEKQEEPGNELQIYESSFGWFNWFSLIPPRSIFSIKNPSVQQRLLPWIEVSWKLPVSCGRGEIPSHLYESEPSNRSVCDCQWQCDSVFLSSWGSLEVIMERFSMTSQLYLNMLGVLLWCCQHRIWKYLSFPDVSSIK